MNQIVNEDENNEDDIDDKDGTVFGWNEEEHEERRAPNSEIDEDDRKETTAGMDVESSGDEDFVVENDFVEGSFSEENDFEPDGTKTNDPEGNPNWTTAVWQEKINCPHYLYMPKLRNY